MYNKQKFDFLANPSEMNLFESKCGEATQSQMKVKAYSWTLHLIKVLDCFSCYFESMKIIVYLSYLKTLELSKPRYVFDFGYKL
jgi:hypothetical protein